VGRALWSDGYFVNTVSKFGSEATIRNYVKNQGVEEEYVKLHEKVMVQKINKNQQYVS
jgi:putative transposase